MEQLKRSVQRVAKWLLRYDAVVPLCRQSSPAYRRARGAALALIAAFLVFGFTVVGLELVDNKPTVASTGLMTAHQEVTLDVVGWFSDGIWWRGRQTPTPLPVTVHGLFFALFGYSVRGILLLHTAVGAASAWLLFRIVVRRFDPWTGLVAMLLYLSAPLFCYIAFSGWTFIWATMFLLLAIDLLDRAVLTDRVRLYLLAGVALGCAGMSRPENYAVALLGVALVPFTLRYRALFLLLVLAYPLAQYAHNQLYLGDVAGLRILDDAREGMGHGALFEEWFGKVSRVTLDRNFSALFQWMLIPAILFFGLPRHRFLAGVLIYFWVAFFAAYAMRRISFNHEGYYFAHVCLSMPFLAAALVYVATRIAAIVRRATALRDASIVATSVVLLLLIWNVSALREAYAERLLFNVPDPVREVRDELHARLEDGEPLVLDYFAHVSWMLAEIESPAPRDLYYYNTNPTIIPRPPLNAARKDIRDDELVEMNAWIGRNFTQWSATNRPRYYVTLSDDAWRYESTRKRAMGHYRMFSLRPAMRLAQSTDPVFSGGELCYNGIVFANSRFYLYDLESAGIPETLVGGPFEPCQDKSTPVKGWSLASPGADGLTWAMDQDIPHAVTLHPQPGGTRLVRDECRFASIRAGTTLHAEAHFSGAGPAVLRLGFNRKNGERYNVDVKNPAGKQWERVHRVTTLPADIEPGTMNVTVSLHEGAGESASIAGVAIRALYVPDLP